MVAAAEQNPTDSNSCSAGTVINAGKYGMFRVAIKKSDDYEDEDCGVLITELKVKNEEGAVPEICATAGLGEYLRVDLTHFQGIHEELLLQDTKLEAVAIYEESGDDHLHYITSSVGSWTEAMSKPFCNFDENETYCNWELRDVATKQIVFKISFEKYKPPCKGTCL